MQGSQQSTVLLPSIGTSCCCTSKESCETSALIACIRIQNTSCAIDLLLKRVQVGDDIASAFFQESLTTGDSFTLSLLVERSKQRNDIAFRFLYEYYWPPIFTHIALMIKGNHEIARELTQETFLKAWKELPKTNEETSHKFKAWLYKIASNLIHDYFRQPSQSQPFTKSLEREGIGRGNEIANNGRTGRKPPSMEGPENIICENEFVKEALSQVKPCYREALWLEAFFNGTQAEKARQLHIREGTFSGYVHRGREELKAAYRRLAKAIEVQEEGGTNS